MRRHAAAILVCALAAQAHANGRPPATSTIHFEQGNAQNIVAGMTFGVTMSHDGGATWGWMCEAAVGYAGMYDPVYAYSNTGAIHATTFNGLTVNRDGCTFAASPLGMTFVSGLAQGPDHAIYAAAADPADAKIYRSVDDGMTFPTSASPGQNNDWWQTIVVAPSDATVSYLAGYRFQMACNASSPVPYMPCSTQPQCMDGSHPSGACENQRYLLLFKSTNSGTTYTALPGNLARAGGTTAVGLTTSPNSVIDLVGVSPTDANTLYIRVTYENPNTTSDGIYKINASTDTTWTHLKSIGDSTAFLARSDGTCVIGTMTLGSFKSTACDTTWTALVSPPHINCLVEHPTTHDVWACTHNYDANQIPADGYGIMKSSDLATWTGVLKYQDIAGPVVCAAGTTQHDTCQAQNWCPLRLQLGVTANPTTCNAAGGEPTDFVDAGSNIIKKPKAGCCDTGSGGGAGAGAGAAGIAAVVGASLLRRRRRPKLL